MLNKGSHSNIQQSRITVCRKDAQSFIASTVLQPSPHDEQSLIQSHSEETSSKALPDFIGSWKDNWRLVQRCSPQNRHDRIAPYCRWSKKQYCRLCLNWKIQVYHENSAARCASSHTPIARLWKTQVKKNSFAGFCCWWVGFVVVGFFIILQK